MKIVEKYGGKNLEKVIYKYMKNNNIKVSLIAYSESVDTKKRIATFVFKIPKFLWGHIISHRVLSRNSASSRAIPTKKIRKSVIENPFIPIYFGENKAGMESGSELKGLKLWCAQKIWLYSRYVPIAFQFLGEKMGVHKEVINRILEPWLMVDIIVTATEWKNFIALRTNHAAQPEIRFVAEKINELLISTIPNYLARGEWHIPFILEHEKSLELETQKKVAAARCARVSYSLFDGETSDIESDIKLWKKLSSSGHWSPFEHIAQALDTNERIANFVGWKQYRKEFQNENGGDYI